MSDSQRAFLDSIAHGGPMRFRFWDAAWWMSCAMSVDGQCDMSDLLRQGLIEVSGSVPAITMAGLAALNGEEEDDL